jgi:predicted RNA-binding Zn-ribbon protein involved in translation (DUF1610 family)
LIGDPIPEDQREMFGGSTNFARQIAIIENDHIVAWQCPDCGKEWKR